MEFGTMMGLLLSGLQFTAIIFVITLVGALPLGVLVALGRMRSSSRCRFWCSSIYRSCAARRLCCS